MTSTPERDYVLGTHDAEIEGLGLQHRVWRPQALVDRMRGLVRPGGRVVMHEYLDYAAWRLLPDAPAFEAFVEAVIAAWRQAGGEPNVGRVLPGWLEDAGFRVDHLRPIMDVVSPADVIWQWPRAFVDVGLERLVAIGTMAESRATETWQDFLAREASPHVRMVTPIVLEILPTRPH